MNNIMQNRLISIKTDEKILASSSDQAKQEQKIAISDLLEQNYFSLNEHPQGKWKLELCRKNNKLVFNISDEHDQLTLSIYLSLSPFRKVIKDYSRICESYYEAIEIESRARIETIDMARKAIHDEGANLLQQRLQNQINADKDTARRLFTLVSSLYRPGLGQ